MTSVENICDLITWPWPRWLLSLSLPVRLSLCLISFAICQFLSLHILPFSYNWSILTIPMGLSSWLFLKRGACSCYFSLLFFEALSLQFHFTGVSWSSTTLLSFICNACILFIEGSAFVSLHKLLANAEISHQQAKEGARLSAKACEQQRILNQLKNRFIINVNHELRTPLTTIYSYLEMLQLLCTEYNYNEPIMTNCLKDTFNACTELISLTNTVLDTLEIEHMSEPLALEPVLLLPLLENLLDQLNTTFSDNPHPITLAIPPQASVLADKQYLYNILRNLLINAFSYTTPTTSIKLSTTTNNNSPSLLTLCITDAGPGIPPEEIPLLFRQFIRLECDLAGPIRGVGLGLYIAKQLTEAMGGRIWAESQGIPGQGTSFYISLPASSLFSISASLVR